MNRPTPFLAVLAALALLAAPAGAAEARRQRKTAEAGSFSSLMSRISAYLNSEPVRKARVAAAVAAVRGGIPTDQGEDLDQRLLDRTVILRERILAGAGADEARKALRPIYSALAVSQWVQSIELAPEAGMKEELGRQLRNWAAQSRAPQAPQSLRDALSGPLEKLDSKALVAAGWGAYCRGITAAVSAAPAAGASVFDAESARLDELLGSLKRSWLEKKLPPVEEARAHALAGSVYAELAKAPLTASAVEASKSSTPASSAAAPAAPAPRRVASAEMKDTSPEFVPRRIYDRASKAVVLILCATSDGSGELGSGSILDNSGRILTNAHVVIRDSTRQPWPEVRVYMKPAKMTGDPKVDLQNPRHAKVLAWDVGLDLALIQMEDPPSNAVPLALGDPDDMVVGDRVAAIGHPEQGGLWTLTTGVVSTLVANLGGVKGKNAFQTDASINRGNSGGPLLNAWGDIVGVNTLMSRKAADGLAITAVNFAVRSDVARDWLSTHGASLAFAKVEGGAPSPAPAVAAAETPAPRPSAQIPPARPAATSSTPTGRPAPVTKETITESKPYDRDRLIEEQIKEMEDLEEEMHQEVQRHR